MKHVASLGVFSGSGVLGTHGGPWGSHGGSLGVRMVTLQFLHRLRRGWAGLNHVISLGAFSGIWTFGDPWGVLGGPMGGPWGSPW